MPRKERGRHKKGEDEGCSEIRQLILTHGPFKDHPIFIHLRTLDIEYLFNSDNHNNCNNNDTILTREM